MFNNLIYIVDDDETNLILANEFLKEEFENVELFNNSWDVLNAIDNKIPDLLLSDIKMPDLNGIELNNILFEKNYNIPIILMTALDYNEYNSSSLNYYKLGLIRKPYEKENLVKKIKKILDYDE